AAEWIPDPRPIIIIGPDEDRVADEGIAALVHDRTVFQRNFRLVRVLDDDEGTPHVDQLPKASLRERLAAHARWRKRSRDGGLADVGPAALAVEAIMARGTWQNIPRLAGVTTAPFMRPDGTIATVKGFDAPTGMLFLPTATFPVVPTAPTAAQVKNAVATL